MIAATSFAVHITYKCPLSCAHCCYSCDPGRKEKLAIEHIISTIKYLPSSIRLFAITGGEPFLYTDELPDIINAAHLRNFTTRIVTSAFWGTSIHSTKKIIAVLSKAGLNELSISWDDYHERFVPFQNIYNVYWTAKKHGLTVAINIVQSRNSKLSALKVRKALGIDEQSTDEVIVESPLNFNGRAKNKLRSSQARELRTIGPCPYVLTGPTLSARNKLLACCGVIPEVDELIINSDFSPQYLVRDIRKARKSLLFNYLFLRGPYSLIGLIQKQYGLAPIGINSFSGNCEACSVLFNNKDIASKIPKTLASKAKNIQSELFLLKTLNLLEPRSIYNIWKNGITVLDTSS